MFWTLLL